MPSPSPALKNRICAMPHAWRAGSRGRGINRAASSPGLCRESPLMLTGMHNALGKGQGMGLSPLLPPPRKREDKPPQGARQWVVLPFGFAGLHSWRWPLASLSLKTAFCSLSVALVLVFGCGGCAAWGAGPFAPWGASITGVLSRNRRKFRQPINVACPSPGRWGRPNSRVTSRHFDHGNASRMSRPDCSGLDGAD